MAALFCALSFNVLRHWFLRQCLRHQIVLVSPQFSAATLFWLTFNAVILSHYNLKNNLSKNKIVHIESERTNSF